MQSPVCVSYVSVSLLDNSSVKTLPRRRRQGNNGRIVGPFVFCAVSAVSKESLCIRQHILLSFLGKGAVNMFPRQQGIVGVVFCAVHVLPKGNGRLIRNALFGKIRGLCGCTCFIRSLAFDMITLQSVWMCAWDWAGINMYILI